MAKECFGTHGVSLNSIADRKTEYGMDIIACLRANDETPREMEMKRMTMNTVTN